MKRFSKRKSERLLTQEQEQNAPKVRLTKEDIQNGWTEETLSEYLKTRERQKVAYASAQVSNRVARIENVTKFNPHKWG